ncbi:MAG TPA: hypothetical protein H9694_10530 [Firmicutes bacterium]|nr:hypothetical protein [Bacillota bacterium]
MPLFQASIYKTCTTVVIMVLLLTGFCLANLEAGTGPYYFCLFTLILDVPFLGFLLFKLARDYWQLHKEEKERKQKDAVDIQKHG